MAKLVWPGSLFDPVYGQQIQLRARIPAAAAGGKKSKLSRRKKWEEHTIKGDESDKKINN